MGQVEILEFLYKHRASGNDTYFSMGDIVKALGGGGDNRNIKKQISALFWKWGYLETTPMYDKRNKGAIFFRKYRLSMRSIKTVKRMLEHNQKINIVKIPSTFPYKKESNIQN